MTANELYKRKPESESHDICAIVSSRSSSCHVPEIQSDFYHMPDDGDPNKRVTIKYYKNFCFDGRRVWILASVWFDNQPVMIIQNAGREGDDHSVRFITNNKCYNAMVNYLRSFIPDSENTDDIIDPDADIKDLTYFYSKDLDSEFKTYR